MRLIILVCLLALPAFAEDRIPYETSPYGVPILKEAADKAGIVIDPSVEPEGSGVSIRPLDDSDPEMRERTIAYFEAVPCQDQTSIWQCQRAKKIVRDGGDRLAHYLIRQIELNEREGWGNEGTYITLVGLTESPIAYDWLRRRVFDLAAQREAGDLSDASENRLHWAIEALGDTRAQPASDDAVALLQRFPTDDEIAVRAVRIVEEVQEKHGAQPRAQEAVRALKTRRTQERFAEDDSDDDGYDRRIENALNPGQPK